MLGIRSSKEARSVPFSMFLNTTLDPSFTDLYELHTPKFEVAIFLLGRPISDPYYMDVTFH